MKTGSLLHQCFWSPVTIALAGGRRLDSQHSLLLLVAKVLNNTEKKRVLIFFNSTLKNEVKWILKSCWIVVITVRWEQWRTLTFSRRGEKRKKRAYKLHLHQCRGHFSTCFGSREFTLVCDLAIERALWCEFWLPKGHFRWIFSLGRGL